MVGLASLLVALGGAPERAAESRVTVATKFDTSWIGVGDPALVSSGTASVWVPRGRRISYRAQQRAARTRRNRRLHHGRGR
jgi:hypothetical protein